MPTLPPSLLLAPPIVFVLLLVGSILASALLKKLAFRRRGPAGDIGKAYSCGEDVPTHLIQPDYAQFFPFAFFFTILHVVALIITMVPIETLDSFRLAVIYILGAAAGLIILFRR